MLRIFEFLRFGHFCALQVILCDDIPGQKSPLLEGAGLLQTRFLILVPPPQERSHEPHRPHPPQPPLTII